MLTKHPWYASQWQARLQDVPVADHSLVLFMQAARSVTIFAPRTRLRIDRSGSNQSTIQNAKANGKRAHHAVIRKNNVRSFKKTIGQSASILNTKVISYEEGAQRVSREHHRLIR